MKYSFFLFIIILFFSCQDPSPSGHWHLSRDNEDKYFTIDIEGDSLAFVRYYDYGGYYVGRIYNDSEVVFPGGWDLGSFRFSTKYDNIAIQTHNELIRGYKCENDCCNLKEDLIQGFIIDIDLPQIDNNREELNPIYLQRSTSLILYLFFGKPKPRSQDTHGDSIQLMGNDKFMKYNQIPYFIEEKKMKIEKRLRHKAVCELVADKSTPISKIKHTVRYLKEGGIETISIICFKENTRPYYHIEHLNVDSIDLNHEGVLSDIVN